MDGPGLAWTRVLCRHTRPCTYARRRDRDRALGLGLKQGAEGATVLCGMGRVGRGISKSCRTCEVERRASTSEVTKARARAVPPWPTRHPGNVSEITLEMARRLPSTDSNNPPGADRLCQHPCFTARQLTRGSDEPASGGHGSAACGPFLETSHNNDDNAQPCPARGQPGLSAVPVPGINVAPEV
jgi:hypothetical protein